MELFQIVHKCVIRQMQGHTPINEFYDPFNLFSDDLARVNHLLKDSAVVSIIDKCILDHKVMSSKCGDQALQWKKKGNELFKKRIYFQALTCYNRAIMMCDTQAKTQDLSLCYANRSAVLFHMGRYEDCISDIRHAIDCGYSSEMLWKLHVRQAKCFQFGRTKSQLQESVDMAQISVQCSNLSDDGKKVQVKDLENFSSKDGSSLHVLKESPANGFPTNEQFPALTDLVTVNYSPEFGNHIASRSDVQTGDTILIEKPYSSVTLGEFYETHCCHCQKRCVYSALPCDNCSVLVFCSETCKSEGWCRYHKYECKNMAKLKSIGINMGHLSLRTALQAECHQLSELSRSNEEITYSTPYQSNRYLNIALLQGHTEERTPEDLFWRTLASVLLARLTNSSAWSDSGDGEALLAAYTLHNLQVFPCNAHEISELVFNPAEPCRSETLEVGAGIYATLSFFNHSCDPSVVRTLHDGNECHVTALCPITKGEQVFDNYGAIYAAQPIEERRKKFSQYYFECACLPCVQNWPSYSEMDYSETPMFKCPKCRSLITGSQCCREAIDTSLTLHQLSRAKSLFEKELIKLFKPAKLQSRLTSNVAAKLTAYSNLVNSLVFRPYRTLNDCQEALKHVLACQGNSHESDNAAE